jgi:hypothetical protein
MFLRVGFACVFIRMSVCAECLQCTMQFAKKSAIDKGFFTVKELVFIGMSVREL